MKYAPVIITTLSRHKHFKKCIESLRDCYGSEMTDVFIAIDNHYDNEILMNRKIILNFLKDFSGFKSINIIKREKNFGVPGNIISILDEVLMSYDRFIITEDDNEFSKDFLNFINNGLQEYYAREDIFAICGYVYPTSLLSYQKDNLCFGYQGFSAWGWGGWRHKYKEVSWDHSYIKNLTNKLINTNKISAPHIISDAKNIFTTRKITRDTIFCMHQYEKNMFSIFPFITRVRNLGHDGSGENCSEGGNEIYSAQKIYDQDINYSFPKEINIDLAINKYLDKYLSASPIAILKNHPMTFFKNLYNFFLKKLHHNAKQK